MQKTAKLPETTLPPERRDDVHVSANRCPYCHADVELEGAWVSCRGCQARHHQACWDEGSRCGSCGKRERLIRDPGLTPSRIHVPVSAAVIGVGLCALGIQLPSMPGESALVQVKYCGAWGLLSVLVGVWLAVRTTRLLLQANTRTRLSRTVWLILALPVLGLIGTGVGLAGIVDVLTLYPGHPGKDQIASGQIQAWLTTKVACAIALPLLALAGLGLLVKREHPERE